MHFFADLNLFKISFSVLKVLHPSEIYNIFHLQKLQEIYSKTQTQVKNNLHWCSTALNISKSLTEVVEFDCTLCIQTHDGSAEK